MGFALWDAFGATKEMRESMDWWGSWGSRQNTPDELSGEVLINANKVLLALHPGAGGGIADAQKIYKENKFFLQCGKFREDLEVLKANTVDFQGLGKLAKSGDFYRSSDRRWVLKACK